jgi:hypothetical protein
VMSISSCLPGRSAHTLTPRSTVFPSPLLIGFLHCLAPGQQSGLVRRRLSPSRRVCPHGLSPGAHCGGRRCVKAPGLAREGVVPLRFRGSNGACNLISRTVRKANLILRQPPGLNPPRGIGGSWLKQGDEEVPTLSC